jgi:MFS family permease
MFALLGVLWYQGFIMPMLGVGAPWITRAFGLTPAGMAKLYASTGLGALLTFGLSRLVDRTGRRRVILACLGAASVFALGAAFARSVLPFAVCILLGCSMVSAMGSSAMAMLAEICPNEKRAAAVGRSGMAVALGGATCLILAPLFAQGPYTFRGLLGVAAGGILGLPWLCRVLPESKRWEIARDTGALAASSTFGSSG